MSNIKLKQNISLWQTILTWFRGNSQLIKPGEYTHYQSSKNPTNTLQKGDVLTGFFKHPKTGEEVFGNAEYLGEDQTPNYKLLKHTKL